MIVYRHLYDLLESIEDCIRNKRILPCLTLLYCGIDVVSSLDRAPHEKTRAAFVRWVENYMLKPKRRSLECSAIDLYAARCGIVHTFTAAADLVDKELARPIAYAWGTAEPSALRAAASALDRNECVVHVRDLIDAFRKGLAEYLVELDNDPSRETRFNKAVSLWFNHVGTEEVSEFLRITSYRVFGV